MEAHPDCALTFHRVINFYESTGEKTLSNGMRQPEYSVNSLSRSNYITNLSVMYRRDLVDLQNLPAWIMDHRSPDYAIHMLYAVKGTMHYFPRPMGVYRKVEGAIWSTADAYRRLKMSLEMRLSLMKEFESYPEVVAGLLDASTAIARSMLACASDKSRVDSSAPYRTDREEAEAYAERFGIDVSAIPANAPAPSAPRRSVFSRLIRRLSRLVPRPRP